MESTLKQKYEIWMEKAVADADLKPELEAMAGDEAKIEDAFYKDLEFGTAGLRGVIGAGTNRMNVYIVARASQGLSNYVIPGGKAQHRHQLRQPHQERCIREDCSGGICGQRD